VDYQFEPSNFKEEFHNLSFVVTTFDKLDFEKCEFKNCRLSKVTLESCTFIDCVFLNCLLDASIFTDSEFVSCVFRDSKLINIDWTKAKNVQDMQFEKCVLEFLNFRFMKLPKIVIKESEAKHLDFQDADLHEGIFTSTNFEGSTFLKTNLEKADFRLAYNYAIDTKANNLKKAKFSLPEATTLLNSLGILIE
jgi:fluoroquinolone resistance protein